jgi:acyl-coenzyme A synthetase/AMP-(fatty) acid ligase
LGEAIRAYVVAKEDAPADLIMRLLQHAGGRLPEHKVPSAIELRLELPKNASGKIQRRALRELFDSGRGK